eukprot:scaffold1485_cov171-Amphora_coffeaeformis.AAC.19
MAMTTSLRTWVIFLVLLILRAAATATYSDPYAVLKVPNNASQDEIRQSYRSLCLTYHPDKNVAKSPKEKKQCEDTFKEIQKAYSLIGNPESRKNHDIMARYSTPYGSPRQHHQPQGQPGFQFYMFNRQRYNSIDEMFQEFFRQQQQRSAYGAPSFGVGAPVDFFNLSRFKSIYIQTIPVSLEDLYTGRTGFEMSLKASLWQRLTAAFRGGLGWVLLYQSILFALPILRISKLLSLAVGLAMFQTNIPEPDKLSFYANLKAGYKEGTKFTFSEERFDTIFVLKEMEHRNYVRQGNDLHTTIYVTPRQARRGAKVRHAHLDGSPLLIQVPAGTKNGQLIRLAEQGWLDRRKNTRGNLLVQVRVKTLHRRRWP